MEFAEQLRLALILLVTILLANFIYVWFNKRALRRASRRRQRSSRRRGSSSRRERSRESAERFKAAVLNDNRGEVGANPGIEALTLPFDELDPANEEDEMDREKEVTMRRARLEELKDLHQQGLVEEEEYKQRKWEILSEI